MVSSRPPGDASGPPNRRRRSAPSYEAGLRALGSQIDGGASDADPVANEHGLRSLGDQINAANAGGTGRGSGGGRGTGGGRSGTGGRGRGGRGGRGRRRWSTRRKITTAVVALVVLALLVVGGAYGYARYRYDQIPKVHVASEQQQVTGKPFNMLVIGSDSRVGDKKGTSSYGTSTVVGGQRSDVMMVWHVDPTTKQITVISIPRDTLVSQVGKNVTTFGQFNRINSAYNSGATLLVQTIEANFGIPISHVVQVDFAGFRGAVDALGGIYMNFNYPARTMNETTTHGPNNETGLDITKTGCQLLTGTKALAVARSRHYQYYEDGAWHSDPTGDYGRIKRQDAFLRALIDKAKSSYNPVQLNAFLGSIPQGVTIDDALTLNDMIGLAEAFHGINPTAINTLTIPTETTGFVTPWGDVLFIKQPTAQQMLVSVFGTELTTPTSPPPNLTLQSVQPPAVTTTTTTTAPPAKHGTTTTAPAPTETTTPTPSYDPTPCSP
ncbi:MAG TPA: LCP family protein [Acidimicrobiales bacterium]|nr:LCP family protein [Acidimicrobiales bacterium]